MNRYLMAIVWSLCLAAGATRGEDTRPSETPAPVEPSSNPSGPPAQGDPLKSACVVDIQAVLDGHIAFQAGLSALKKEAEEATKKLGDERESLLSDEKDLKKIPESDPDYSTRKDELTIRKADWIKKAALIKADFKQRESQLIFEAYQEIKSALAAYCKQRNIRLVLRIKTKAPDPKNSGSVETALGQAVAYFDPPLDITAAIIQAINSNRLTAA